MKQPPRPVFLERQNYRFRRVMDGARLLPILGMFLFMLPLLWQSGGSGGTLATQTAYVFSVWLGLIVIAAVLARRLRHAEPAERTGAEPRREEPE